jgi:RNA-binding protein
MIRSDKNQSLRKLKSKAMEMVPSVIIGKLGLTEGLINEIKAQIEKKRTVKVKMLRSFIGDKEKSDVITEILDRTGTRLVQKVGFVITVTKK